MPFTITDTTTALLDQEHVLLLFAHGLCAPSLKMREYIHEGCEDVVTIYISLDDSLESFHRFFNKMTCYAIPYAERELAAGLMTFYELSMESTPSLLFVNVKTMSIVACGIKDVTLALKDLKDINAQNEWRALRETNMEVEECGGKGTETQEACGGKGTEKRKKSGSCSLL